MRSWQTFMAEPLSTRMVETHFLRHFMVIWRGLLWSDPSGGRSLSLKAIVCLAR